MTGTGAVIVSTPQDIALKDAARGVEMFKKVNVPVRLELCQAFMLTRLTTLQILGMVQNMSSFTCPDCHSTHSIFGSQGVSKMCARLGTRLLGDVPLDAQICADADRGKPTIVAEPEGPRAAAFHGVASKVRTLLGI